MVLLRPEKCVHLVSSGLVVTNTKATSSVVVGTEDCERWWGSGAIHESYWCGPGGPLRAVWQFAGRSAITHLDFHFQKELLLLS